MPYAVFSRGLFDVQWHDPEEKEHDAHKLIDRSKKQNMKLFPLASIALFLSLCRAALAQEDLASLKRKSAIVTDEFDWEWVLIRINGIDGPLEDVDFLTGADIQVVVTALGAIEPDVDYDKPISQYRSIVEESTDSPEW